MDSTFIQWLIGQSGIAGLAAMSLYLLNRAQQDAVRREQEYANSNRADKLELMKTLADNTKALTSLESVVEVLVNERRAAANAGARRTNPTA